MRGAIGREKLDRENLRGRGALEKFASVAMPDRGGHRNLTNLSAILRAGASRRKMR
jgi:hypothetical protein